MTSAKRMVAGGLTVLESAWLFYLYFGSPPASVMCPASGCEFPQFVPAYSLVGLALAAALLIVGILGVWGASFSYTGGAGLSAIVLLLMIYTFAVTSGYAYLSTWTDEAIAGTGLSLVAALGNVLAVRSRSGISEQANPLNLPVFG